MFFRAAILKLKVVSGKPEATTRVMSKKPRANIGTPEELFPSAMTKVIEVFEVDILLNIPIIQKTK